ncbi:MAG: hypothetical protein ACOY94_09945 [Bacillota bacterium]
MHDLLKQLEAGFRFTGEVGRDVPAFLIHHKCPRTAASSARVARDLFGVTDEAVLSAIGCHTTLKRDASLQDQAALAYLQWMWEQRASLRVVHPWLREAYEQLSGKRWSDQEPT